MLDLDDLKKMNICDTCKCLYMPEYEEDYYGEHAVNDVLCVKCVEGDVQ